MSALSRLFALLKNVLLRLRVFRIIHFHRLLLVLLVGVSFQVRGQTTSLKLVAGWNLVGNSSTSPVDLTSTFSDATKVTSVWKWNSPNSAWAFYSPSFATTTELSAYASSKGYQVMSSILPGEGFWVYAKTAFSVSPPLGMIAQTHSLTVGWNLVGNDSGSDVNPIAIFGNVTTQASTGSSVTTVWTWDSMLNRWNFFSPSLSASILSSYAESKGYGVIAAIPKTAGFWMNANLPVTVSLQPAGIKVKASSYENKNAIGMAPTSLPNGGGNAFALADFFQDGTPSLVMHTLEYNPGDPNTYSNYGHIHFYKNQNGTWVDNTSALLSNAVGCIHPRKAVIADFNNDGKPDVYFACHGIDAPPFPGEQPHILLSQLDGTYKHVTLSVTCYCHGASAADINGDGFPDVLVVSNAVTPYSPYFLINNRDGTFTPDYSRLPSSLSYKQIFTAELIDFENRGKYDVFLGGNEPGSTPYPNSEFAPQIFPNDGSGKFISTTPVSLFATSYGLALDIIFQNGYVYLLKVNGNYTGTEIVKVTYPSAAESVIYSHSGAYPSGGSWFDWIIPYDGKIVSENARFGVSVVP